MYFPVLLLTLHVAANATQQLELEWRKRRGTVKAKCILQLFAYDFSTYNIITELNNKTRLLPLRLRIGVVRIEFSH